MAVEKLHSDKFDNGEVQEILALFHESDERLGEERNTIKLVSYGGQQIVVKSFKVPNLINRIAYRYLRKSKARRSYENAKYLVKKGIGTPTPLAYVENYDLLSFTRSFYLSQYVDYDFTFREVIHEDMPDKEQILIHFTRFVHRMHESKIYFLDHSPGNTLIKRAGDGYEFYLVDLNRMRFYDIPLGDRIKNFERLAPYRWVYAIMGAEYARLMDMDAEVVIEEMWMHVEQFQYKFKRKRKFKSGIKSLIGKS